MGVLPVVVIEQRHLDAAKEAGACSVAHLTIGADLSRVSYSDLCWFEYNCPTLAAEAAAMLGAPIWTASRSGSGDGYGYGSMDGDGYGHGYGYGDGDGAGDGY